VSAREINAFLGRGISQVCLSEVRPIGRLEANRCQMFKVCVLVKWVTTPPDGNQQAIDIVDFAIPGGNKPWRGGFVELTLGVAGEPGIDRLDRRGARILR